MTGRGVVGSWGREVVGNAAAIMLPFLLVFIGCTPARNTQHPTANTPTTPRHHNPTTQQPNDRAK